MATGKGALTVARWGRAAAQHQVSRVEDQVSNAENTRQAIEAGLGTDEQQQLTQADALAAQYGGRYSIDEATAKTWGKGSYEALTGNLAKANDLLGQAEQAAREGRAQDAARLKAAAESSLTGGVAKGGNKLGLGGGTVTAEELRTAFRFDNALGASKSALASTEGKIVGQELRRARAFQDWDSTESVNMREQLGEGAQRSLAAGQRDAIRGQQLAARRFGAGSNAMAEMQASRRTAEGFAAGKAQIQNQVANTFEGMRTAYAKDSVSFARSWLDGTSGVRDEFTKALGTLGLAKSTLMAESASTWQGMGQRSQEQHREAVAARRGALTKTIGAVAAVAGSFFTGGMSLAALGGGLTAASKQTEG